MQEDHSFIILSDRGANARAGARAGAARPWARYITTWCATARASSSGSSLETGEAREVHHFCLLAGYGAGAINPYVALDTVADLVRRHQLARHST